MYHATFSHSAFHPLVKTLGKHDEFAAATSGEERSQATTSCGGGPTPHDQEKQSRYMIHDGRNHDLYFIIWLIC